MSLSEEYKHQYAWRDWESVFRLCPISSGQKILDLGCGPGDLSKQLALRGAIVTGVDSNSELLNVARETHASGCQFLEQDLRNPNLELKEYDALWCSFTAAYFTNFEEIFSKWLSFLKDHSWVCFVEIDDLFGHQPMTAKWRDLLDRFYAEAFSAGRYDFKSGSKIEGVLKRAGFKTSTQFIDDLELSFSGVANQEVLNAWEQRFARMGGLQKFFGDDFEDFKRDFLDSIKIENHRSLCKVICTVGVR